MNPILITALISIATGAGGYWLKFYLDKKQNAAVANAAFRRKLYQEYAETILSFYSISPPKNETEIKQRTAKFIQSTNEFHKKFVLDASPGVIRAIKNLQQYNKQVSDKGEVVNGRKGTIKNAKVFKQMRRDLGSVNWGLGRNASVMFGPVLMNSYEQDMHPLWWSIKRIIYTKVPPFRSLRLTYIKIRDKFYAWSKNLEADPKKQKSGATEE